MAKALSKQAKNSEPVSEHVRRASTKFTSIKRVRKMKKITLTIAFSILPLMTGCMRSGVEVVPNAAVSAANLSAKNAPYTDEEEQKYNDRFAALVRSFSTGVGLNSYDLMKPVVGKPDDYFGQGISGPSTIDQSAIQDANAYAAASNSSVLIVYRNGKLETEKYFGNTQADTLLNSKSFAKPLTAIAVGRALALGHIQSLDEPVANYIAAWRNDPRKSKILVRHLLDMRTGFLPQAAAFKPENILNRAYLHPRHEDVIIHDYPVVSDPGERYDYSNATSEMVAPLIEAATGQQYEDFIAAQVLQPIGANGGEIWMNRPDGTAHSGCCILLPARDWMRLSVLLLNDGQWKNARLLPEGYVQEMRTATPENPYYGMGVWVAGDYIKERGVANPDKNEYTTFHGEPYAASDLFLFDGNANQVSYIVPSEGLVILRMGKSPPKTAPWDNSKLPNIIIDGIALDKGGSVPQISKEAKIVGIALDNATTTNLILNAL